jgi:hypothetical protein
VSGFFVFICKEKSIFYTDQSCFDKKIEFSYHIKKISFIIPVEGYYLFKK